MSVYDNHFVSKPKQRLHGELPKIGIRPAIDGRQGGLWSLEIQIMNMAHSTADTIPVNESLAGKYQHFCSHKQTRSSHIAGYDGSVRNGDVICFSRQIFTQYYYKESIWCRNLLVNAVKLLLAQPGKIRWPLDYASDNKQTIRRKPLVGTTYPKASPCPSRRKMVGLSLHCPN